MSQCLSFFTTLFIISATMTPFAILYEDNEIYLLNKPAGVPVQGGQGIVHSLDDDFSAQVGYRIHLVHRLDKETAGILIVAKTGEAAAKWMKLIAGPLVQKEYTAICIGEPVLNGKKAQSGTIKGIVEAHGREQSAETHFVVEKVIAVDAAGTQNAAAGTQNAAAGTQNAAAGTQNAAAGTQTAPKPIKLSLLHITLGTGRMHQIRIQLAKSGAPIAADDQHGDFKANKALRKAGIKRLQLAAVKLTIPVEGRQRTFTIPLPEHMNRTVEQFFK